MAAFKEIPVLDLSLARSEHTKPGFLRSLRDALINVGFLYIQNVGIPQETFDRVCAEGIGFFDLPEQEKLAIEMVNKPSFLGYSKLGNEITASKADWREQLDLSTPHPEPSPSDPLYHNLLAPNQWPSERYLPNFRTVFEGYMAQLTEVSFFFTSLIAESLELPSNAFDRFFASTIAHKLKVIKYPDMGSGVGQGVGPPIRGTLVVAIGQGLEALTGGVCASTSHRVLSPKAGEGPRFSIPFFQGVSYDAPFETVDIPPHIRKLRDEARRDAGQDDVEFSFVQGRWDHLGEAALLNRVRSHVDVGARWYPELLKQIQEAESFGRGLSSIPKANAVEVGVAQDIKAH